MHVIISLDREVLDDLLVIEVGQQVEDVLEVVDNVSVHGEIACENLFHIGLQLFNLGSKSLESIHLVLDLNREIVDGHILDVSQEMLNADLLGFGGVNGRWDMNEVLNKSAILINFLNRAIGLGRDRDFILFLNLGHNVDGVCVVKLELLIDLNIVLGDGRAGRVPSDDSLLRLDLSVHAVHVLMIDMI